MVSTLALMALFLPQEPASPAPVQKEPKPDEATYVEIVDVPLSEAVAERKVLTDKFLDKYESFFMPIGGM